MKANFLRLRELIRAEFPSQWSEINGDNYPAPEWTNLAATLISILQMLVMLVALTGDTVWNYSCLNWTNLRNYWNKWRLLKLYQINRSDLEDNLFSRLEYGYQKAADHQDPFRSKPWVCVDPALHLFYGVICVQRSQQGFQREGSVQDRILWSLCISPRPCHPRSQCQEARQIGQ